MPVKVRFTTWTLRYNRSFWVQVDGRDKHWERATHVDADLFGHDGLGPEIITKNVSALTLTMPSGHYPPELDTKPSMTIDGEKVDAAGALSDRSWTAHFRKVDSHLAARSIPMTTARFANGTDCKGQSTTPSWTASSWSGRRARR